VRIAPVTVRWRVTAVASLAIIVVLVAVGWGLVVNHRRELTSSLDERMTELADDLADGLRDGEPLVVDRVGGDDWVVQLVAGDREVIAASEAIAELPPLGAEVDDQRIGPIDPLPGTDDDAMRLLSRTVEAPQGRVTIHIAAPTDDIAESVATLERSLLVAVPLAALVLGVLTWLLVGRTLRSVEEIRAAVDDIGGGDLHRRVPVPPGDDEIARLARTMNDMLARVEESQERQRRFVADASHELRGPLTRMRTELEVDLGHPATADPAATHRSVLEEVVGLQQLVDDLLVLARRDSDATDPGDAEWVDVGDIVRRAQEHARDRDGVDITVDVEGSSTTFGRRNDLQRAVGNVLDNAVRHARSAVQVSVLRNGESVAVAVEDDGDGVPLAERERIFERFARVDWSRSAGTGGAGLGLSIAREVVERHGGTIELDPRSGRGARFVITLPSTR
jgi:signal transduction histidine kinase